ncbi:MAG: hypothetical protein CR980_01025, partial [Propionibacteriales bacterium]
MKKSDPYASPSAVEAAIKNAAKQAWKLDPTLSISERIRMEYHNRFLCRVFGDRTANEWVLKGGSNMLARVASTRVTHDLDLLRSNHSAESALVELGRLAAADIGDFFSFRQTDQRPLATGRQQPYLEGYRVEFGVYIGRALKSNLGIDLVTNSLVTDRIDVVRPASALNLPRLPSAPYRLYPVVDQIADKVSATHDVYSGRESSREKDLVDLVVLALTQRIDGSKLERAIRMEAAVHETALPRTFQTPRGWGKGYSEIASGIPVCSNHETIDAAKSLMASFIDPVL